MSTKGKSPDFKENGGLCMKEKSLDFKENDGLSIKEKSQAFRENGDIFYSDVNPPVSRHSSAQWITLTILAFGTFSTGACISLQAPFFPREAESKGATAADYGLVFGVFELAVFISAPIMGRLMAVVEPKFLLNSGALTIGVTYILSGTLDFAPYGHTFLALAFAVRAMEGVGAAAARTSGTTIIASEFKERAATAFGVLETSRGMGYILGPTLGGALYDLHGYSLPFFVMGSLLVLDAGIIFFMLPKTKRSEIQEENVDLLKFWLNPGIMIYSFTIFTTFSYYGFGNASLEPHIRRFGLSGTLLGIVFAIGGLVYALSSSFWGYLNDKKLGNKLLILIACTLMATAQILVGPLPFFKTEPKLELVVTSLFLLGLAVGGKVICSFSGSLRDTIARGFPPDLRTYGLISAMYTSSESLGAFMGPSIGGYLVDSIGFRTSTVVFLAIEILLMVMILLYASIQKCRKQSVKDEEKPIIAEHSQPLPRYS